MNKDTIENQKKADSPLTKLESKIKEEEDDESVHKRDSMLMIRQTDNDKVDIK